MKVFEAAQEQQVGFLVAAPSERFEEACASEAAGIDLAEMVLGARLHQRHAKFQPETEGERPEGLEVEIAGLEGIVGRQDTAALLANHSLAGAGQRGLAENQKVLHSVHMVAETRRKPD